jgi:hypothetical protein
MYSGKEPERADDGGIPYSEFGVAEDEKVEERGSCPWGY